MNELDSISWIILAVVLFFVSPIVKGDDVVSCVFLGESGGLHLFLCAVEVDQSNDNEDQSNSQWW